MGNKLTNLVKKEIPKVQQIWSKVVLGFSLLIMKANLASAASFTPGGTTVKVKKNGSIAINGWLNSSKNPESAANKFLASFILILAIAWALALILIIIKIIWGTMHAQGTDQSGRSALLTNITENSTKLGVLIGLPILLAIITFIVS